jgi:hypothetical protein
VLLGYVPSASIEACRDKIVEVVEAARKEFQGLVAFNTAFVSYRDLGEPCDPVGLFVQRQCLIAFVRFTKNTLFCCW